MKTISLVIPGKPQPKERAAPDRRGVMRTQPKTLAAEKKVEELAVKAMQGREPLFGPVRLSINVVFETPAGWNKAQRAAALEGLFFHVAKPDLDNIEKMVLDGMNGVVYYDDQQIAELFARKRYGSGNRIEVIAEEIPCPDNHPGVVALRERIAAGDYALKVGEQRRRRPQVTAPEITTIGRRIR